MANNNDFDANARLTEGYTEDTAALPIDAFH